MKIERIKYIYRRKVELNVCKSKRTQNCILAVQFKREKAATNYSRKRSDNALSESVRSKISTPTTPTVTTVKQWKEKTKIGMSMPCEIIYIIWNECNGRRSKVQMLVVFIELRLCCAIDWFSMLSCGLELLLPASNVMCTFCDTVDYSHNCRANTHEHRECGAWDTLLLLPLNWIYHTATTCWLNRCG